MRWCFLTVQRVWVQKEMPWEFGGERALQDDLPREARSRGQNLNASQGTNQQGGAGVGRPLANLGMCVLHGGHCPVLCPLPTLLPEFLPGLQSSHLPRRELSKWRTVVKAQMVPPYRGAESSASPDEELGNDWECVGNWDRHPGSSCLRWCREWHRSTFLRTQSLNLSIHVPDWPCALIWLTAFLEPPFPHVCEVVLPI